MREFAIVLGVIFLTAAMFIGVAVVCARFMKLRERIDREAAEADAAARADAVQPGLELDEVPPHRRPMAA